MLTKQRYQAPILDRWPYVLRKLFGSVGLILISAYTRRGPWKVGKTDFALFIAENLLKYGIVSEVASNINTKGHFPQISDLVSTRNWLHSNSRRKLYILDEINIHATRRRAMSSKNVGILALFPEISKARANLLGVGQDLFEADKQFIKQTWCHGVFLKRSLKSVQTISHMIPNTITFKNIPKTSVPFDPYEIAPFTERPEKLTLQFKDKSLEMLADYIRGTSKSEVCKLHDVHRMQFDRVLKRYLEKTLPMFENLDVLTENDALKACVIYHNGGSLQKIMQELKLKHPQEARRLITQGIGQLLKRPETEHLTAKPKLLQED